MSDTIATDFGDNDPEDGWDDGDDFETKLAILERLVESLRARRNEPTFEARRQDGLRLVNKLAIARDRVEAIRAALEDL